MSWTTCCYKQACQSDMKEYKYDMKEYQLDMKEYQFDIEK